MSGKVSSPARADGLRGVAPIARMEIQPVRPVPPADSGDEADLRLIIEETGEDGEMVYTIVDRRTGRVVSQLSREEVLRLKEKSTYTAGAVFDGKI